ncbi:MAG: hypothetical protein ACKVQK_31495 [Burkholderiales bacterium]
MDDVTVKQLRDFLFDIKNQDMSIQEFRTLLFNINGQFENVTAKLINDTEFKELDNFVKTLQESK